MSESERAFRCSKSVPNHIGSAEVRARGTVQVDRSRMGLENIELLQMKIPHPQLYVSSALVSWLTLYFHQASVPSCSIPDQLCSHTQGLESPYYFTIFVRLY